MFFLYNLILPLIAILFLPVILIAFIAQPKFRAGFVEKIGFYSFNRNNNKTVVFHAVSVGEVNAISALVKRYREKNPDINIILTTTTKTGQEVAHKTFSNIVDKITYFPYDFVFSVNAFFNTFKPEKIIIAETEIWPGLVSAAKNKGIKVYIVNGRISPNSYKGYRKFSIFFKPILSKYEEILMQSESDAKRIIDIGASKSKVKVMGNLKFDIEPNLDIDSVEKLKNQIAIGNNKLIIAASTHSGEDEIVLDTFKKAKTKHSELKLLIAPRHPQRYDQVETLLKSSGFLYGRRSLNDSFSDKDIIMLDTMGELSTFFSLAFVAFIGGSFASTGGHNPLEANIWGKPVISGPNVFNFKDVYKLLVEKGSAVITNNADDFLNELLNYIENENTYNNACNAAKEIFVTNKGAIDFVINELS